MRNQGVLLLADGVAQTERIAQLVRDLQRHNGADDAHEEVGGGLVAKFEQGWAALGRERGLFLDHGRLGNENPKGSEIRRIRNQKDQKSEGSEIRKDQKSEGSEIRRIRTRSRAKVNERNREGPEDMDSEVDVETKIWRPKIWDQTR